MADKNYKVLHKRSDKYADGNGNNQGTYEKGPKLPEADNLEYGELAVNYAEGAETISFKNRGNKIVTIQNEILVSGTEVDTDTLKSTAKLIIDESADDREVEIYTKADIDGKISSLNEEDNKLRSEINKVVIIGNNPSTANYPTLVVDTNEEDNSQQVYTKVEVDAIIAKLKADNNLK